MKIVIQRVTHAAIEVNQATISSIEKGLLVLAGFEHNDTQDDFDWICKKIIQLRIFDDENGHMNVSCKDIEGEILVVSQFTLFASTQKGNRPSYIKAAPPEMAKNMYNQFVLTLQGNYRPNLIKTGLFGASMQITLLNNGPVTIIIDSKNRS